VTIRSGAAEAKTGTSIATNIQLKESPAAFHLTKLFIKPLLKKDQAPATLFGVTDKASRNMNRHTNRLGLLA